MKTFKFTIENSVDKELREIYLYMTQRECGKEYTIIIKQKRERERFK